MTDDKKYIEKNLDRLLELGDPVPKMPEDLKDRIRSRLIEIKPESEKKKLISFRWVVLPLAAAAALVLFILFPWLGNLSGSITWADVKDQLEQFNTISFQACGHIKQSDGKEINLCSKVYVKDPGLIRQEIEVSKSHNIPGIESGTNMIQIRKQVLGRAANLMLYTESRQARLETWLWNSDNRPKPFQSLINGVFKSWEHIKKITEDETRIIGEREISGIKAIGFNIEGIPPEKINLPDNSVRIESTVTLGEIWVNSKSGIPIMAKVDLRIEVNSIPIENVSVEYTDFKWDVPLDESLFNMDIPEGWNFSRKQVKIIDYKANMLAPDTKIYIWSIHEKNLITSEEIIANVQAVETSYPGSNIPNEFKVTIELTHEAARSLKDYINSGPNIWVWANFNDEIDDIGLVWDKNRSDQASFTFKLPGYTISTFEEKYLTCRSQDTGKN